MQIRQSTKGVRIAAAIIDYLIIYFIGAILNLLLLFALKVPYRLNAVVTAIFIFIYYTLIPFFTGGSTIGKLIVRIKVVSANYQKASFLQLLLRNIFLYENIISIFFAPDIRNIEDGLSIISDAIANIIIVILFWIIYLVIFIMILTTQEERGFHDYLFRTLVVSRDFVPERLNELSPLELQNMEWAQFEDEVPNPYYNSEDWIQLLEDENDDKKDQIRILGDDE